MFNIQKAVSRLDFAPGTKEIRVTDVKKGLADFTPKPDRPVSFAALKTALKKAGYALASADVTVVGTLARAGGAWAIVDEASGQRFELRGGAPLAALAADAIEGGRVEVTGSLTTVGAGAAAVEVIAPTAAHAVAAAHAIAASPVAAAPGPARAAIFAFPDPGGLASPLAPVRTTSPGLTVYKGGAVALHYSYTRQHLGALDVSRQGAEIAASYTPTSTLQLGVDLPFSHISFRDGGRTGASEGFGNLTVWGKYRFFRTLETWGDRQASARFGLELPTGRSGAPDERALPAPAFVREQLSPIDGGLAAHADLSYSQAHGRVVLGGNVEGVARAERDGYRVGHEIRVNTDFEYVLFPFHYDTPTRELFALVETTFVHRGVGRSSGAEVPGSRTTELLVAPAVEYVAGPRVAFEASYQLPVARRAGPLALRTDRNLLLGVKLLF